MSDSLFDEFGRCIPAGDVGPAHPKSRRYFLCDEPDIDLKAIYDRTVKVLGPASDVSAEDFANRVGAALSALDSSDTANMTAGVHVPFLIPANSNMEDLGSAMLEHYLPALETSYLDAMPESEFAVEVPNLAGRLNLREGTNHDQLMERLKSESIVGILFPCMTEYSIPAALNQTKLLPENCITAGALDVTAALIGVPRLLIRDEGYPPTLWLTAIEGEQENIGYHFEAYGYNLKLYRRAHLSQPSEYWWQSVTVLA